MAALCRRLEIPPLRAYGVGKPILPGWWKRPQASSMKGNPIVLTAEELRETIARAI